MILNEFNRLTENSLRFRGAWGSFNVHLAALFEDVGQFGKATQLCISGYEIAVSLSLYPMAHSAGPVRKR
ncbi:MAG: hypothetical protein L7S67_00525 [Flavobacteriales bacterium]|nr:hypothetical protein [Flavobacteriales bacterium]